MVGPTWRVLRRRAAVVAMAATIAGLTLACRTELGPGTLHDLAGVEQLKARFNRDRGKARAVLLLSPT